MTWRLSHLWARVLTPMSFRSQLLTVVVCLAVTLLGRVTVHSQDGKPDGQETGTPAAAADVGEAISFHRQIWPLLQTSCVGCHQGAKDSGAYVMTSFDRLLAGGESGEQAILPGKPDDSYLVELITPSQGQAEMPVGKDALAMADVALIRRWIEQGARNDTPAHAMIQYDSDHPPTYRSPPVITSLASSPDGLLLAVAGFHEVLLHRTDGSGLAARLIGTAQRIESVTFSPDGARLAAVGGLPGRRGELQVWDVSVLRTVRGHRHTAAVAVRPAHP